MKPVVVVFDGASISQAERFWSGVMQTDSRFAQATVALFALGDGGGDIVPGLPIAEVDVVAWPRSVGSVSDGNIVQFAAYVREIAESLQVTTRKVRIVPFLESANESRLLRTLGEEFGGTGFTIVEGSKAATYSGLQRPATTRGKAVTPTSPGSNQKASTVPVGPTDSFAITVGVFFIVLGLVAIGLVTWGIVALVRYIQADAPIGPSYVVAADYSTIGHVRDLPAGAVQCFDAWPGPGEPSGVEGAVVWVLVEDASGPGSLVVYGDDGPGNFVYFGDNGLLANPTPPAASTVLFEAGVPVENTAFIGVGSEGRVCVSSVGASIGALTLRLVGVIDQGSGVLLETPERLVDTRAGSGHLLDSSGPLEPSTAYSVDATASGIPPGTTAILANITVVGTTQGGSLRVWADGLDIPEAAVVNYYPGAEKSSAAIIPVSSDGTFFFASVTDAPSSVSPVQVIIDVEGYVNPDGTFAPVDATRFIDTREVTFYPSSVGGELAAGESRPVSLATLIAIPSGATALALQVAAIDPSAAGWLAIYAPIDGECKFDARVNPAIPTLPGRTISDLFVVGVTSPAEICVGFVSDTPDSRVNATVDLVGYFEGGVAVMTP